MSNISELNMFKQLQENSVEVVKANLIEQVLEYNGSKEVPPSIQDLGQREYAIKSSLVSDMMGCHKRFVARVTETSVADSEAIQKGSVAGGFIYLSLHEVPEEYSIPALKKKSNITKRKGLQKHFTKSKKSTKVPKIRRARKNKTRPDGS